MVCLSYKLEYQQQSEGTLMADTIQSTPFTTSTNAAAIPERPPPVENSTAQIPAHEEPLDEELLDEELEEELIIEDFTIDGICGVY
jgi:mycofactocin precursor